MASQEGVPLFQPRSARGRRALGSVLIAVLSASSVSGEIVINEIHYDPALKADRTEFIELYNTGPDSVDLSGWRLTSAVEYTFPIGTTLASNAYAVVAEYPFALDYHFGYTGALGPYVGFLSGDGERVRLRDAADALVDEVDYGVASPWPTASAGSGGSMELVHPSLDNNLGGSWRGSGAGTPATSVLVPSQSTGWRYRKGTSEASTPIDAWRAVGFTEDGSWLSGQPSIGYGDGDDLTTLSDMQNTYSTLYLRHALTIGSAAQLAPLYTVRVYVDDGAVVWINGNEVARVSAPGGTLYYNSTGINHEAAWVDVSVPAETAGLVVGDNVIAVHALNQGVGSSDFSIDLELVAVNQAGGPPSPGARNNQYATNVAPQARQIEHAPKQPKTSDPIVITAKVTDPDGVASVGLAYQVVSPGNYIPAWLPLDKDPLMNSPATPLAPNPAFSNPANWTTVAMLDTGTGGDAVAGDSVYTATLSAVAENRALVRYRVLVEDALGESARLPYEDDPSLNYACYVYDGVPDYVAGSSISYGGSHTYPSAELTRLPVYHVMTRHDDLMHAYAYTDAGYGDWQIGKGNLEARRKENWECALVYDGHVYDHVMYRLRQSNDRYAQNGKRSMRFNFRKGNYFRAKDHFGRAYPTRWRSMNVANGVRFSGSLNNVLPEGVNFELFRMFGLAAPRTQMFHMRVVDGADEAPTGGEGQYYGDFYGYYLGLEVHDEGFKDSHGLADGNMYKLRDGWDDGATLKKAQGRFSTTAYEDYENIRDNLRPERTAAWLKDHVDFSTVYKYHAVVEGIRDYDTGFFDYDSINNKNQVWLFDPTDAPNYYGRAGIYPHDTDATWSTGYPGTWGDSPFKKAIVDGAKTEFLIELRNAYRAFRDLVWQEDVIYPLIDQHAAFATELAKADRDRWYDAPVDAGHNELATLEERVDQMKGFAFDVDYGLTEATSGDPIPGGRAGALDIFAGEGGDAAAIPDTPSVAYVGVSNHPVNGLNFSCSTFHDPQGDGSFAAMMWRLGEVTDTNAPAYNPTDPLQFEMPAVWQSAVLSNYVSSLQIPVAMVRAGHAYRVRVKMKDDTGRWSHWSAPYPFIAGPSDVAATLAANLRVSEVMYHPGGGEANRALEFIEFHNAGTNTVSLAGVALTKGVDFDFGDVSLGPDERTVVVRDALKFAAAYPGVFVAGEYAGKLSDAGEMIRVRASRGGVVIQEFDYDDGRGWPVAADGAGHALVPEGADLDYGGNWSAGAVIGGTPGRAEPPMGPHVVLNEIGAHTDYSSGSDPWRDSNDWIELFNPSSTAAVFDSHWWLSDDPVDLKKWNVPAGSLAAGNWALFTEVDHFHPTPDSGFGLDKAGERVYLSHLPGGGLDRVVDAIRFKGQPNGATTGRFADGAANWIALAPTPGTANAASTPVAGVDEFMYHPSPDLAELEYIELHNRSGAPLALEASEPLAWGGSWSDTWRIDGGVQYNFPAGTTLAIDERILVVAFDPTVSSNRAAFLSAYALTDGAVRLFGPYAGRLSNGGERFAVERPQAPDEEGEGTSWILVDEIMYSDGPPWFAWGDGDGLAPQRAHAATWGRDPSAWVVGLAPSPGRGPDKIALSNPVNGEGIVTPATLRLAAQVDERLVEGAVSSVDFHVNGAFYASDSEAPFTASYPCPSVPGTIAFKAVLNDAAGASESSVATITIHTNQPSIQVSERRMLNGTLYSSLALDGVVDPHGLPVEMVDSRWIKISGAGSVSFSDIGLPATRASFSEPGEYVLGLVTDYGGRSVTNVVSVSALTSNVLNPIPYEEHFEDYDEGRSLVGVLGWYGGSESGGKVAAGSRRAAASSPVMDRPHEKAMSVGRDIVSRFENAGALTDLWFDALVDCRRWNDEVDPVVSPAERFALMVGGTGALRVWHDQGAVDGWTTIPGVTFTNGQWARFTVRGDFTPGASHFRLWVDGAPVTSPQAVFAAAGTNQGAFAEIELSGQTMVDDLVVEDYDILNYRKLTIEAGPNGGASPAGEVLVPIGGNTVVNYDADPYYHVARVEMDGAAVWTGSETNLAYPVNQVIARHTVSGVFDPTLAVYGTPQWWLAAQNPTWAGDFDAAALADADADGAATWKEYVAGTDPEDENSAFVLYLSTVPGEPQNLDLSWDTVPGRTYRAFSTTNLYSGVWTEEAEISGTGATRSIRDANPDDLPRYYRVEVELGP